MVDDPDRVDPKGTMETVPPPTGAKDAYSAQTRVATLPEHVLEAMRKQETDASLEKRTKSGMRASAAAPLAPPPVPTFDEPPLPAARAVPPPLPWSRLATPRAVRPSGQHPVEARPPRPLRAPSPLAPLALRPSLPDAMGDAPAPPPAVTTPQDGWLAGAPPLGAPTAITPPAAPPMTVPLPRAANRGLARSLLVIAVFALLGGLVAAAITLAGY